MSEDKGENFVGMSGFTLLQIIAWINGVIQGAKDLLEEEEKSNELARLQGKIPGCKFSLNVLKEQFQLSEDFMSIKAIAQYGNMTYGELLGARHDFRALQETEPWKRFIEIQEAEIERLKTFLLIKAEKSRSFYLTKGRYEGIISYRDVFGHVEEAIALRQRDEPLFNQEPEEEPGTDLVPVTVSFVDKAPLDAEAPEDPPEEAEAIADAGEREQSEPEEESGPVSSMKRFPNRCPICGKKLTKRAMAAGESYCPKCKKEEVPF